jgi:RNA polymerase sigma-70 factor (ECF subfamily)
VFWKGSGRAEAAAVVVPFDVDRPVVEAAKRDAHAFEPLYRRYVAHIYSLAFYETRDPHAAEDITELVFLKALDGLPRFREQAEGPGSTFKVWLYAIARHVIANERRTRRRRPVSVIEAAHEVPAPDDPAAAAVTRLEAERAWQAVLALPDERRQALQLRIVHELSAREIGDIMGKSEGAVRVLIHRALAAVRQQLSG